jgi:hypothetical protein
MKNALLFIGVFGFAVMAGGQTPGQEQRVRVKAESVTQERDIVRYRGHVEIALNGSVVVADEVDVPMRRYRDDGSPNLIQLRGNVGLAFDNGTPVVLAPER